MKARLRIDARSVPWLREIDHAIRQQDVRGTMDSFRDIASDLFDGRAMRQDLDDLIKCRFLDVVRHGYDDSCGPDPLRMMDQKMCGSAWSVNVTKKMIRTFWPARLRETKEAAKRKAER